MPETDISHLENAHRSLTVQQVIPALEKLEEKYTADELCDMLEDKGPIELGRMTPTEFNHLPSFCLCGFKLDLVGELLCIVGLVGKAHQHMVSLVAGVITRFITPPLDDTVTLLRSTRTELAGAITQMEADEGLGEETDDMTPSENRKLIVEVGHSQRWDGKGGLIEKRDRWFAAYPSLQIVILIGISQKDNQFRFEQYRRSARGFVAVGEKVVLPKQGGAQYTLTVKLSDLQLVSPLPPGQVTQMDFDLHKLRDQVVRWGKL